MAVFDEMTSSPAGLEAAKFCDGFGKRFLPALQCDHIADFEDVGVKFCMPVVAGPAYGEKVDVIMLAQAERSRRVAEHDRFRANNGFDDAQFVALAFFLFDFLGAGEF